MNFDTKEVQEHTLKFIGDCTWQTTDGKSQLDEWEWQVVTFKSIEGKNVTK